MSKYTTEVRFICENKAGFNESVGANSIDDVLEKSWDKIFTTKTEFFDEAYRKFLCKKILKHYYLREIGSETVGIWTFWMNTRLEEIMPYYNQLYKSQLIEFNPMHDIDLTKEHKKTSNSNNVENEERTENSTNDTTTTGNNASEITGNGKVDTTNSSNTTRRDLYSDTPQGALTGIENENYLTNARKTTDETSNTQNQTNETSQNGSGNFDETSKSSGNVTGSKTNNGTFDSTESYLESVIGKTGGESYSKRLLEFRETFLNIDMQVIDKFQDLFFGLW